MTVYIVDCVFDLADVTTPSLKGVEVDLDDGDSTSVPFSAFTSKSADACGYKGWTYTLSLNKDANLAGLTVADFVAFDSTYTAIEAKVPKGASA